MKSSATGVGIYRALRARGHEIRVLLVQPGTNDTPIQATLQHVVLSPRPSLPYETVSYVWGDPSVRANMLLNGHQFDAPASSERVLRRMRHANRERVLWIDAICINQQDLRERGRQVAIMGKIYAASICNLVWLGDDDGNTAAALESIADVTNEIKAETNDLADFNSRMYSQGQFDSSNASLTVDLAREAIVAFYRSPWFSRLWVCQEAALAPKNIAFRGSFEVPLDDVLRVAAWLTHKILSVPHDVIAACRYPMVLFDWIWGKYTLQDWNGELLLPLLTTMGDFHAQDPRDHVYGLLGIHGSYDESPVLSMLPNYEIDVSDVFREAARVTIRQRMDLAFLSYVYHERNKLDDSIHSTWTPRWDWNGLLDQRPVAFARSTSVSADNRMPMQVQVRTHDPKLLIAAGISVDVVVQVSPKYPELQTISEIEYFLERVRIIAAKANIDKTSLSMAMLAGQDMLKPTTPDRAFLMMSAFEQHLDGTGSLPQSSIISHNYSLTNDPIQDVAHFYESMKRACFQRRIFCTESGRIGVGPKAMLKDDVVAILYGSRLPVILRKSTESVGEYRFVGDAYVHSIMSGGAVQAHRLAGGEEEMFAMR